MTFQDYYLLMPEAIKALEEREASIEHVQELEDELSLRRQQLEQLQGQTSCSSNTSATKNKVSDAF
jgi:hypothetical protein